MGIDIGLYLFGWSLTIINIKFGSAGRNWIKLFELENGYQDEYTRLTLLWISFCKHYPWINLLTMEQEGFNEGKKAFHWIRGLFYWSKGNPELTSFFWKKGSWAYGADNDIYFSDRKIKQISHP